MFELRVLNGLHEGAALPLIGDRWLIGADNDNDLALHDPGVQNQHCQVQRSGEHWALTAQDCPVLDEEGHPHQHYTLPINKPFAIADVWLAITSAEDAWPSATQPAPASKREAQTQDSGPTVKIRVPRFKHIKLIVSGIFIGVVSSTWGLSHTDLPVTQEPEKLMNTVPAPVQQRGAERTQLTGEQAHRKLQAMLSDRLLSAVKIDQTDSGLVLTGNLGQDAQPVYQRMLKRFDETYQSGVAITDRVGAGGTSLPFSIVQIISGPQAHLITADGKRLYLGDELGGVRLARIDEHNVVFEGDHHYEVTW